MLTVGNETAPVVHLHSNQTQSSAPKSVLQIMAPGHRSFSSSLERDEILSLRSQLSPLPQLASAIAPNIRVGSMLLTQRGLW
jgi:hypothetical protein